MSKTHQERDHAAETRIEMVPRVSRTSLHGRRQHHVIEQLRVKKARIRLTGFYSIAHMTDEARDGEVFPHLETHLEVFGNLIQIPLELVCRGRTVERRVVSYSPE
ncbi:MAG: hypothetical protein ABIU05_04225 [Nitrospirales bacterium]